MSKKVWTVEEVMTLAPQTADYHQPLSEALKVLRQRDIRHLPVLRDGKLVGILSERNLKVALGVDHGSFKVGDAMMPDVFAVPPTTPVWEVAEEMALEKFGSAIVVDKSGAVVGVFTTTDACRLLAQLLQS